MVAAVAVASGAGAVFAGCSPTGRAWVDGVLAFGVAALVAWAAAAAGWRVLLATSAALVLVSTGAIWVLLVSAASFGASAWLANHRASVPVLRAAIGALIAQSALRIHWNPFFLSSAMVAAVAMGAVVCVGVIRRPRTVRRRVVRALLGFACFVLVAAGGLGVAAFSARGAASEGYRSLLEGLDRVGSGDTLEAAEVFLRASDELAAAHQRLSGALTLPARAVPVLAPNLDAGDTLLSRAAEAARAAGEALALVDLDQLQIVDGVIDVNSVAVLAEPLGRLETAVLGLQADLQSVRSPWLLGAVLERVAESLVRADKVAVQARGTVAAARLAPDLLGASGERRYLVAFTSPAEVRGQSGLMGNWAELTVDDGRLRLTANGRTNQLVQGLASAPDLLLEGLDEEFFERYGDVGAGGPTEPVAPKYWSNVTMSPDMPTVGTQMAQMYRRSTGRSVDGVFVLDPAAIAALLDLTGPVELPAAGVTLDSANTEELLLRGQYDRSEEEREALLDEATKATVQQLLQSTLPGPQVIAAELGPAAQSGHLSAWAARPLEQELLQLVGMDAALPVLAGTDGLGVSFDNSAGNKIDSFQDVSVDYSATADPATGVVDATVTITMRNSAPSSGLPDYVIGNLVDLPAGTARTRVTLLTPLDFDAALLDGKPVGLNIGTERGWSAFTRVVDLSAGATATLVVHLQGVVEPGPYRLVVRPQPLAHPIRWHIAAEVQGAADVGYTGRLDRRSVVSAEGADAYRSEPAPQR